MAFSVLTDRKCPPPGTLSHTLCQAIRGVVSGDHVHILVSAPPTMAPSEIMRRIKGRSSSKLMEEYPKLRQQFWGRHLWGRGYFCSTVGQVTEEMIKAYLEHHFEPNPSSVFGIVEE